jgi:hypothetical protein
MQENFNSSFLGLILTTAIIVFFIIGLAWVIIQAQSIAALTVITLKNVAFFVSSCVLNCILSIIYNMVAIIVLKRLEIS